LAVSLKFYFKAVYTQNLLAMHAQMPYNCYTNDCLLQFLGSIHMAKTSAVSARIDPLLKKSAEEIFRDLGLTTSQAITLFYRQVEINEGLPFAVKLRQAGNARSPRGKYAFVQTSSEVFARRKHEEIALER